MIKALCVCLRAMQSIILYANETYDRGWLRLASPHLLPSFEPGCRQRGLVARRLWPQQPLKPLSTWWLIHIPVAFLSGTCSQPGLLSSRRWSILCTPRDLPFRARRDEGG